MITYVVTEEEINVLESVRGQLRMLGNLLDVVRTVPQPVAPGDMSEFLCAQEAALSALLQTVDARREERIERDTKPSTSRKRDKLAVAAVR